MAKAGAGRVLARAAEVTGMFGVAAANTPAVDGLRGGDASSGPGTR
ncbi:hypothetical protein [Nocardiopsis deserti]|nr:hypothetical protein [Nocardiopsis deserti]